MKKTEKSLIPSRCTTNLSLWLILKGKHVLEIGCGRGGGARFLAKYHQPEHMMGLDISKNNIRYCQSAYNMPNLNFVLGDAENLPFEDEKFDVVINLESSHAYPHIDKFLEGVNRVLKPGGMFCWADFRYKEDVGAMNDLFENNQFEILHEEDLTPGVLQSLSLDSKRKEEIIRSNFKMPWTRWFLGNFAVLESSSNFKSYRDGDYQYLWRVMKPIKKERVLAAKKQVKSVLDQSVRR